jgi:IS605 OrfB family transposase
MQNTVTQLVKIPDVFRDKLDKLSQNARQAVDDMLENRDKSSSKFYPDIPCVIAKSLISKYQRNHKCESVKRLTLPICGDKGKQIKIADGGFRIPAVFGKTVIHTEWMHQIEGHIRQVELLQRHGKWFATVSYNTVSNNLITPIGCVGIDRNSVGNIAVMADPQNGKVEHLGFNPSKTKEVWRGRKKNLQKLGKNRLLSKIRNKQGRRTKLENHIVSKRIVDYAASHCRAIAIENLKGVVAKGSKIRKFSQKSQWSFYQLETFIRYKAALRGVTVISVPAEYTSQECSRCGSIQKPNGKKYVCGTCGHIDHRDANAGFNIAKRGNVILSDGKLWDSVSLQRGLLIAPSLGNDYAKA